MGRICIVLVLIVVSLAACSDPPKFETKEIGDVAISRHHKNRTGLGLRKQVCQFVLEADGKLLSYREEENNGQPFQICNTARNGDILKVFKVVLISGRYDGPKERYFARSGAGVDIQLY